MRVLAASGQLGFGIPVAAFEAGIARRPDLIGCDMGSIDPGPYYLGSGEMAAAEAIARRDLELVLAAARSLDVPLIIGSAGTAGAKPHLKRTVALVQSIARERGLRFRLATIESDIAPDGVVEAWREGRLTPIGAMPAVTEADIRACSHIVGQCGTETFRRALALEPDVLVAGRACDTAIFAALPEMRGYPIALALHMAKIIECTSLCCEPGGRDAMLATLDHDGFVLESMHPDRHATPRSVAAHALYEQADPLAVLEPTGTLHLDTARYEAIDAHRTRVTGARWEPAAVPSVKIEGAVRVGERAVLLAGVADPIVMRELEPLILPGVERAVRAIVAGDWQVYPRIYPGSLVIELVAPTAAAALAIASVYRQNLLHFGFAGRISTAGNVAFPITPPELAAGTAYRFALYHAMRLDRIGSIDPLFRVALEEIGPWSSTSASTP